MLPRRSRQRKSFEELALPHLDAIHFAALRLVDVAADADDLVQETFCKAYQNFKQLRAADQCRAWLFSILFNTSKNMMKKGGRETLVDPLTWEDERWNIEISSFFSPVCEQDPETLADHRLTWRRVEESLACLSGEHRLIIVLADVEGFTYREIAATIDVPIGTVMSRLSRARQELERLLCKIEHAEE